ncbi:SRSF2 [Symbiodinium sp. KB8]|nr:SRSF2 [Symbiodinium sp. KB8]|mmetsp:Transcript_93950/g.223563  ORF Transcript_93950/g.223563 Transcript_93950/m.223563 type:complete len:176 (-) Transcript_93950:2-529(-)
MAPGGGLPDISGMTSLKVDVTGQIPENWTAEELRKCFEKFGDIGDVFIPRERFSDRPRPFAFVRFKDDTDATEAIKEMNGTKYEGSTLSVSKANRSREEARAETARDDGKRKESKSRRSRRSTSRGRRRRSRSRSRSSRPRRQRCESSDSGRRRRRRSKSASSRSSRSRSRSRHR